MLKFIFRPLLIVGVLLYLTGLTAGFLFGMIVGLMIKVG